MNGNGGREITEGRTISEWESATCDPADATRSASKDSTVTREREDGALRRCRRSAGGGDDPRGTDPDGEDGGARCPRCTGTGECQVGTQEFRYTEVAVSKRRGCSYSGASKRACFSRTRTAEEAVFLCGRSDPDSGVPVRNTAGSRRSREDMFKQRRWGDFSTCAVGVGSLSLMCEPKSAGGVINGERRARLHRVRSFLASAEESGVAAAQSSEHAQCKARPWDKPHLSVASSSACARPREEQSGKRSPAVNGEEAVETAGSWLRQVGAAQSETEKRQVQLGERTDMIWRRLHAVQVKQVERHVTQQLGDLRRAAVTPNAAELSRLARSCSEAICTAGGALDSDHTASSSGGGSDTDEEEEGGRGARHVSPSRVKSV